MWQSHEFNRHFVGVAVDFLAGFAFLEVSITIIVTVHFFIWKVIRISTTSLPEGWNQPPACVLFTLHRPLTGIFIVQNVTVFVNIKQFVSFPSPAAG